MKEFEFILDKPRRLIFEDSTTEQVFVGEITPRGFMFTNFDYTVNQESANKVLQYEFYSLDPTQHYYLAIYSSNKLKLVSPDTKNIQTYDCGLQKT